MESSELYHVKQQFILGKCSLSHVYLTLESTNDRTLLGAYQSLIAQPLPPPSTPDFLPTLLYQSRSHIALSQPSLALTLLQTTLSNTPSLSENVAIKAVTALAKYINEPSEVVLEELRDLVVEVESEEWADSDATGVRCTCFFTLHTDPSTSPSNTEIA